MKFSELDEQMWNDNKQYFDTCLLPITGLTGEESPIQVTAELKRLRDIMDLIEIPYKGRVVTYPSVQYISRFDLESIDQICENMKKSGFKYVIVITAKVELDLVLKYADIILKPNNDQRLPDVQMIKSKMVELWNSK